ncbi:MAG: cysteine desulfurase family protein [Anaerolineae bacterium]
MSERIIYMDHAATTPLHPSVVEAMLPAMTASFGNPSSVHALGRAALAALDDARREIAARLGCAPREIIFTGGGSEADNLAIRGAALAAREKGRGAHIITTAVEHHAVLHTVEALGRHFGFETTVLPVDGSGRVSVNDVAAALRPDTVLVSVMLANNEIGTLQPVAEIARLAHERGALVHTDAVQAGGVLDIHVEQLGVDMLSLAAHKFYGPKGVGILYVRQGTPLLPTITGGSQERNRRAGTENIPGIVGAAAALAWSQGQRADGAARLARLRDRIIQGVLTQVPDVVLTGHPTERLPGLASFAIGGLSGAEELLLGLDLAGIAASSGSACTSASLEPSYVLRACGLPSALAVGSLRLSLGYENTDADVDHLLATLPPLVERLRVLARMMQSPA